MRNTLIAAVAVLVIATPALAENWDLLVTNDTGKLIKKIEMSPTGANTWQANKVEEGIQQGGPVKAGGRTTVHFDKADKQCRYDVRATFDDDKTDVWTGINVCDNSYATLRYKAGAPVFAAN